MENFILKHKTVLRRASLALLALLVLGSFAVMFLGDAQRLSATMLINTFTNLICLDAMAIICLSILIDVRENDIPAKETIYFTGMLLAQCVALFCIGSAVANTGLPQAATYTLVAHSLVYVFTDVVMFLWWRYLSQQCDKLPRWHAGLTKVLDVLCVLTVLASLSNIFGSNLFFSIDEYGTYYRSDTYPLCLIYSVVGFVSSVVLIAIQKEMALGDRIVLMCYVLLPAGAVVLQSFSFGITLIYIATSFAMTFVFGSVFVRRGKNVLQKEAELAEQRTSILLSQIKPHFLYNSLTAIADLCDEDPAEAQKMTLNFASYLRGNMDSINEKGPIPFSRELAHVRSYLEIEQARFSDKLNVDYDIQVTDFSIPALTLQPIVENAVKYGVKAKRGPGTVTISTRDCGDEIRIDVQDDGPGFDVNAAKGDKEGEGRSHLGIASVNSRLKNMVGGMLEITSNEDSGTRATLRIPRRAGESQ